MKKGIFVLFGIISLLGCKPKVEIPGEFNLLPAPQQFTIAGSSKIEVSDIQHYFVSGTGLPVPADLLKDIQPTDDRRNAQVIFSIDESMDIEPEGYVLDIYDDEIEISGRDKAGLLYGFMTLAQLMEDAKDQDVNLPLCHIKDFPLLAFRAIHIDIKHHREKIEYYYRLMDRLASFKINAIIAEVEDKIQYVRQPEVGSSDALTLEEWQELSDYALERNIEISP